MSINPIEFHSIIEKPWKRAFLSLLRPTYLDDLVKDGKYKFSEANDAFIKQNWDLIKDITLVDPFRLGTLLDSLQAVSSLEGDIVECGCFKGGSAILMGLWLKENNVDKEIHVFDSFEGLPEPDSTKDKGFKKGQFSSQYDRVVDRFKTNQLDNVHFYKGWFSHTIHQFPKDKSISLCHIDCDLYTSTQDCLPLYNKIVKGGHLIFDDFNDGGGGEKLATHEFLSDNKLNDIIEVGPAAQAVIRKGVSADYHSLDGQRYSYANLQDNTEYVRWLRESYDLEIIEELNICCNG